MKNFKKTEKAEGESAKAKAAEKKAGYAKMEMMEGKMHGKSRGARKTNYKGNAC